MHTQTCPHWTCSSWSEPLCVFEWTGVSLCFSQKFDSRELEHRGLPNAGEAVLSYCWYCFSMCLSFLHRCVGILLIASLPSWLSHVCVDGTPFFHHWVFIVELIILAYVSNWFLNAFRLGCIRFACVSNFIVTCVNFQRRVSSVLVVAFRDLNSSWMLSVICIAFLLLPYLVFDRVYIGCKSNTTKWSFAIYFLCSNWLLLFGNIL